MSYSVEVKTDIAAPAERLWAVIGDVAHWKDWTPTVTSITLLDPGPMGVGSRARVIQPRIPKAVWKVTRWEPGRGFEWESRAPGALTVAGHWIAPAATPGMHTVTLSLVQSGPLMALIGPFFRKIGDEYVHTEGRSLKQFCEAAVGA